MLVRTNHGAVDMMQAPVELACGIGPLLEFCQDAVPDAGASPAIEASSNRLPGTILCPQVTPGASGAVEPQQAIDDAAMLLGWAATLSLLWREQRPQPLPLLIGQVSSLLIQWSVPALTCFENRT